VTTVRAPIRSKKERNSALPTHAGVRGMLRRHPRVVGFFVACVLGLAPSLSPAGQPQSLANPATVSEGGDGQQLCTQTVSNPAGITVAKVEIGGLDYCLITFTRHDPDGTDWIVPAGLSQVAVLVVGGGGGGGGVGSRYNWSGGGGAGGSVKEVLTHPVTAEATATIIVGAGGSGGTDSVDNTGIPQAGAPSLFTLNSSSLEASGGGRGGHAYQVNNSVNDASAPTNGGGGGAQAVGLTFTGAAGDGTRFRGGNGFGADVGSEANQAAGGGAGAGALGVTATSGTSGKGGAGIQSDITGTFFGGGGGGGKNFSGTAGAGGTGGGGAGGQGSGKDLVGGDGSPGEAGTGGGGGGGGRYANVDNPGGGKGGQGGSGVVVVRFGAGIPPEFESPTATADGYTVQISNFDAAFSWVGSSTNGGTVTISATGLVTVTGVSANTSSTATITSTRTGFVTRSATVSETSLEALTPSTYTVTFNSNGGSAISNASFTSGGSVTAPATPTRTGFTFAGWATTLNDAASAVSFPYTPGVENDITLHALWTANPPGGGSGSGGSGSSGNSSSQTFTPSPSPGAAPPRAFPTVTPRIPIPPPASAPAPIPSGSADDLDDEPLGTVGGRPANITTIQGPGGGLSMNVGRVQLGFQPGPTPNPAPQQSASGLSVSAGQSAQFSGGGLLPGSRVQIWLPGLAGASPRELGQIPVQNDGTFRANLVFDARNTATPVPIGRHLLQVVSIDDEGNQTVVNMAVTISQGDPAPEPDQSVGALPQLTPGQTFATSAGQPETMLVTVRPDNKDVLFTSGSWTFRVEVPDSSGTVNDLEDKSPVTLIRGQTVFVSGEGFQPDTRVDVWLFSDPVLLGSVTVSSNGTVNGGIVLDSNVVIPGQHTLQLQGVATDGFIKAANVGVLVADDVVSQSALSSSPSLWPLALGVLSLLALLWLIILGVRLRRSRTD
jgi:uncharacterized repeat protein (TIGR02543 family)